MKLRQRPEDFLVVERDSYDIVRAGPFMLYRLIKWDIGTIEALRNIARKWGIRRTDLSFGGLKDRHARTEQVISIRGGPDRAFEGSAFRLEPVGRARNPITRASFRANAFRIVVRGLASIPDLEPIQRFGFPNYFDDQRFGSLRGTDGAFIGNALVEGDIEKALRLALASPSDKDRKVQRERKALLRDRWGDWAGLRKDLPPGVERAVAEHLATRPGAFGTAFELIDQDLRILYVSAYQSWIWNRAVASLLRPLPGSFEVEYAAGHHVFYRDLTPETLDTLSELTVPLVAPAVQLEGASGDAIRAILAEEEVELKQFRIKKLRRTFFGKGSRDVIIAPAGLRAGHGKDELNRGRRAMTLTFELPKGSYATILVKRLFNC